MYVKGDAHRRGDVAALAPPRAGRGRRDAQGPPQAARPGDRSSATPPRSRRPREAYTARHGSGPSTLDAARARGARRARSRPIPSAARYYLDPEGRSARPSTTAASSDRAGRRARTASHGRGAQRQAHEPWSDRIQMNILAIAAVTVREALRRKLQVNLLLFALLLVVASLVVVVAHDRRHAPDRDRPRALGDGAHGHAHRGLPRGEPRRRRHRAARRSTRWSRSRSRARSTCSAATSGLAATLWLNLARHGGDARGAAGRRGGLAPAARRGAPLRLRDDGRAVPGGRPRSRCSSRPSPRRRSPAIFALAVSVAGHLSNDLRTLWQGPGSEVGRRSGTSSRTSRRCRSTSTSSTGRRPPPPPGSRASTRCSTRAALSPLAAAVVRAARLPVGDADPTAPHMQTLKSMCSE